MAKITLESINEELKSEEWQCISEVYTNLDTELHFTCNEGHDVYSTWKKIRNRRDCPICANNVYNNIETKVIPKKCKQRILALDQSSHITGWSILDDGALVSYGTFSAGRGDEIERAHKLKMWAISMFANWKPDYVGIEGIQYQEYSEGNRNKRMGVTVFQTLARVQGILMEACFAAKIPYEVCPTNTWRKFSNVKGKTRTDKKRSMQLLIKDWYDVTVSDDIADSVGIGRYMANRARQVITVENWE